MRGRHKEHRRFLQLLPTGASNRPVGSVRAAYLADGFAEGLGDWKWNGRIEAKIHLESSVSLPIVILAVRLTLGDWAKKAPRIGEWAVTSPN